MATHISGLPSLSNDLMELVDWLCWCFSVFDGLDAALEVLDLYDASFFGLKSLNCVIVGETIRPLPLRECESNSSMSFRLDLSALRTVVIPKSE
jgi:hypothetical protein